jgi:4-amino-4-deoxy-L-arabinose transferase-like glycosyltransferase
MEHDESYSAIVFAFEPLANGLSDYHFPNNHVFHTFLVHISYLMFGAKEWAVRLPAFLAGILLVPTGYGLARRWYGKQTAWASAIIMAVLPDLMGYSARARGYSLMALFTLLIFLSADLAKSNKNRAAWFLLVVFGALGFYTLPIMGYPLMVVYVWLGLSWVFNEFGEAYTRLSFAVYTIGAGLLTVGLGLILYVPIFRNWGVGSLFANAYVEAMPKELYNQTLLVRFQETWQVLNWGAVPGIGVMLLAGLLLTIVFHQRISRSRFSLPLLSLLVIGLLIAVQRPNAYARTWHFYFPLLSIWAAAGLTKVFSRYSISLPRLGKRPLSLVLALFFAVLFFVNGVSYLVQQYPYAKKGEGRVERAALYLQTQLQPDDIVVITASNDAPLWFYFEKLGLERDYFSRNRPFQRAFVVVTTSEVDRPLDYVIADRGPDPVFFDRGTTQKIHSIDDLDVYLIEANHTAIQNEYGLP